jgi:hypothetical protein
MSPDPKKHAHPSEAGGETPEPQQEGIEPLAAGTGQFYANNFSFAPGYAWCEATGPALALTVGANTMTAALPTQGGGEYMKWLSQPLGCVIVAPTTPTLPAGMTQAATGMSPQGFPGIPTPISNANLLGTTAGVGSVTVNAAATPPTVTVNVSAGSALTIPANSRWLIFSLTGV